MLDMWDWWNRVSKDHPVWSRVSVVTVFVVVTFPIWLAQVWTLFSDKPIAQSLAGTKWEFLVIGPLYGWFCFAVGLVLVVLVFSSHSTRRPQSVETSKALTIKSAKYGIDNQYMEATTLLEGHIRNDQIDIPVVELAVPVDPFPNRRKHVKVVYTIGGGPTQRIVRHDGHQLVIPERPERHIEPSDHKPRSDASERSELEQTKLNLDAANSEIKTLKRNWATERLEWHSRMVFPKETGEPITPAVTVRFAVYNDYELAKQVEKLIQEFTQWPVTLEQKNEPVLPRANSKCKVVFVSGKTMSFDRIASAFVMGDWLNVPICTRWSDRDDFHRLVIEILPS